MFVRKFEKSYQAGEIIFNEGDATNEMYFVLDGEVRIIKMVHEEIKELAVLKKGEFFGEMSTFTGQNRVATAVAGTEAKLLKIPPPGFTNLLEQKSDYGLQVVKTLCNRLRQADELIEGLMVQNQMDKIVSIFYNQATNNGEKPFEKVTLNYDEMLKKIAGMTKFSRDKVINHLEHLNKTGKIEITKIKNVLMIEVLDEIDRRDG